MPGRTPSPRKPRSPRPGFAAAEAHLRDHALTKPEATEHFPWGERAIKVKGKVFLFMRADQAQLSLSTKLPTSAPVALMLPFATSTGYGLGKAGWVSASFSAGDVPPLDMLCAWIDESYQAVAPARLAALAGDSTSQPTTDASKPSRSAIDASKPSRSAAATRTPKLAAASKSARTTAARKPALKRASARSPATRAGSRVK